MKTLNQFDSKLLGTLALVTSVLAACSTPQPGGASERGETPEAAAVGQSITGACRLSTVGLPCDPDGNGAATECEGVCWADDEALVSCRPVAEVNLTAVDLNGRICGDAEGRNCGQSCENGACVQKNARLGTACRPTNNSTTCDGVCTLIDGAPSCDAVDSCESVGISPNGCRLTACNFDSFELGCKVFELQNPVCEASQEPVTDVTGASSTSAPDAAAEPPDAAPDTATPGDAGGSETSTGAVSSVESSVGTTSGARQDGGALTLDGGDVAPRPPINNATKVVGGACSTGAHGLAGGSPWVWAGLASLLAFARRRPRAGARRP